ncbi:MAG: choice-of-anchor J domain-containing protein, partial [Bacteroidales bacterium]
MSRILHTLIFVFSLSFFIVAQHPLSSVEVASASTVYGYRIFDKVDQTYAFISFSVDNPAQVKVESQRPASGAHICAAEYYNGKIYAYTYKQDMFGESLPEYFEIYDANTYDLIQRKNPFPYMMHDMAYDHTTNTMYGLVEEKANSGRLIKANLCIIDMESGDYVVVGDVGPLKNNGVLVGLACSKEGRLYGVSDFRCVYEIDKHTGKATQIGTQGNLAVINALQSIAFDYQTDVLYWAHTTPDYGWWSIINPQTGVVSKQATLGGDAEVTGLFFKNPANLDVPDKVEDLRAHAVQPGSLAIDLFWKNPAVKLNNEALSDLAGIQIFQLGRSEIVADIPFSGKSENTHFQITVGNPGDYTYRVIPYNKSGMGKPAMISLFAGFGKPEAVHNLIAVKADDEVCVRWDAPQKSVNGGIVELDKISYQIRRIEGKDTLIVSAAQKEKEYRESLTSSGAYSYEVIAVSNQIAGVPAYSDKILIEGVAHIPYSSGFEDTDDVAFWRIFDVNNDSKGWEITSGYGAFSGKFAQASVNSSNSGNDWIVSPAIALEANTPYYLTFVVNGGYYPNNFKLALGEGFNPDQMTILANEYTNYESSVWETLKVRVEVPKSGNYYFGWHFYSPKGYAKLKLDNVAIEKVPQFDAQVNSIYIAPPSCSLGEMSPVSIEIVNNGVQDLVSLPVSLQTGVESYTEQVDVPIKSGEKVLYSFKKGANLSEYGLHALRAFASLANDADRTNDSTAVVFTYHAKPVLPPFSIGFEAEETESMLSWKVSDNTTASQGWIFPVTNKAFKGKQAAGYKASSSVKADHWLYSTCLELQGGKTYKLSYQLLNNSYSEKTNILKAYLGTDPQSEEMSLLVGDVRLTGLNTAWQNVIQYFTPQDDGVYYLGWHVISEAGMGDLIMDDIQVTPVSEKDILLENAFAQVPLDDKTSIKAILINNGSQDLRNIKVSYRVNEGEWISEIIPFVAALDTMDFVFKQTSDMKGQGCYPVIVRAEVEGDEVPENNLFAFDAVNSGDLTLDFESCKDFAIDNLVTSQNKKWSVIDEDKGVTYGIGTYLYPYKQQPYAILVFNPDKTDP